MWQVYHGGCGREKAGEASQAVTGQIPHAVQGPVQFCFEEHQRVLQERKKTEVVTTTQGKM